MSDEDVERIARAAGRRQADRELVREAMDTIPGLQRRTERLEYAVFGLDDRDGLIRIARNVDEQLGRLRHMAMGAILTFAGSAALIILID